MKRKFVSDFKEFVNENLGQDDTPIEGDEVRGFEGEPAEDDNLEGEPAEDDNLEGELENEPSFEEPESEDDYQTQDIQHDTNKIGGTFDLVHQVIDALNSDAPDDEVIVLVKKLQANQLTNRELFKMDTISALADAFKKRPALTRRLENEVQSKRSDSPN